MKKVGKRGNALIEFVLVLPVALLLLFGAIDFGILFYNQGVIFHATDLGARYGVISISQTAGFPTTAQVITYTKNYCTGNLVSFGKTTTVPTVTATSSVTPPQPGATLTVTISYTYTYLILNSLVGFGQTNTMQVSSKMTYE